MSDGRQVRLAMGEQTELRGRKGGERSPSPQGHLNQHPGGTSMRGRDSEWKTRE